jgi:hypothetical protein
MKRTAVFPAAISPSARGLSASSDVSDTTQWYRIVAGETRDTARRA